MDHGLTGKVGIVVTSRRPSGPALTELDPVDESRQV